tara:strand:+ start:131 stop:1408 length:1278 start_codon:yes stop_codon:yes gene_type:complete
MKKNILTEVVRVHEIMEANTIEEQNFKIGKTIVTGEPTKGEPLRIVTDREAKYKAMADSADDGVGAPFFWSVLNALEEKFPSGNPNGDNSGGWTKHKDKIKLKKVTIRSGASNFYKGAVTEADVMNDRVTPMPAPITISGEETVSGKDLLTYDLPYYDDNEVVVKWDKNSKPYKANLALARRRGENFLVWIKDNLKANGLLVLDPMEKEDVESYVVDTGGVIDKDRVESAYPNPGQFITMDLELGSEGVFGEETAECLVDMKIFVSYIQGKSPKGHNCDAAIFDVFLNKEYVFTANLNNSNDPDVGDSKKHRVSAKGANRVCGMTIGNKLAQKIMSKTNSETIEVGIKGMVEGGGKGTGEPATYKGEEINPRTTVPTLHADVPLVTLKWGDGQKWSGTPNTELRRGDTSYKKIMSFDVCKQEVDA